MIVRCLGGIEGPASVARIERSEIWDGAVQGFAGAQPGLRLLENLGALAVDLSETDIAEISAAIPPGAAAGTRYPEAQMKGVFL